jgi:hypothetical protein
MSKIRAINFRNNNNLTTPAYESVIKQWFEIEGFDSAKTYDKKSTVFFSNYYQYENNTSDIEQLLDQGYKVVFENLHEANPIVDQHIDLPNALFLTGSAGVDLPKNVISVPLIFWFNESKSWINTEIDYQTRTRINRADKKFLMLMHYQKSFRDKIFNKFADILDQGLYSYVGRGIYIDGDKTPGNNLPWDRYTNEDWYNRTQFSVCVETFMGLDTTDQMFITEKTIKPFAMRHPFMVLGCYRTLDFLRQAGFETFENLFDESYDTIPAQVGRIQHVYEQVKNYNLTGYDTLTQQKIDHNFNWFYNHTEVDRRITVDIINPILEFINTQ